MYENSIVFPGFHIRFDFSPVAFEIFGIEIRWYGIIIAFGFLCGFFLSSYIAKKQKLDIDILLDTVIIATPISIIFARLYYVVFNIGEFKNDFKSIFMIRQGGLAIYGAFIGAILSVFLYSKVKKVNFFKICDVGVFGLILGQAIGRWGNFANREAYGYQTSLPWRMEIYDMSQKERISVHPTFLYESLWDFFVLFLLLKLLKYKRKDGQMLGYYLIFYSIGRFFIEGLRTDSLMFYHLRISQIVAIICIILGIILISGRSKNNNIRQKITKN